MRCQLCARRLAPTSRRSCAPLGTPSYPARLAICVPEKTGADLEGVMRTARYPLLPPTYPSRYRWFRVYGLGLGWGGQCFRAEGSVFGVQGLV
eukprot:775827-Rhodomonas_salina.1